MMRVGSASLLLLLISCFFVGCEYVGEAPAVHQSEETKEQNEEIRKMMDQKRNNALSSKAEGFKRKSVMKRLGPVKDWNVSTKKKGQIDEGIVKAKEAGMYDEALRMAFAHQQLELKFFSHLPAAITRLRLTRPRPAFCDLTCEDPILFSDLADKLPPEPDKKTSDIDEEGRARDWYRYSEISLGVVDKSVVVVRIHVLSKHRDWEDIGDH